MAEFRLARDQYFWCWLRDGQLLFLRVESWAIFWGSSTDNEKLSHYTHCTCQCCVMEFHTPILPVWLVATSWLPMKNKASTGTVKSNVPETDQKKQQNHSSVQKNHSSQIISDKWWRDGYEPRNWLLQMFSFCSWNISVMPFIGSISATLSCLLCVPPRGLLSWTVAGDRAYALHCRTLTSLTKLHLLRVLNKRHWISKTNGFTRQQPHHLKHTNFKFHNTLNVVCCSEAP